MRARPMWRKGLNQMAKDFFVDKLHVRIFESRTAMGQCAGNEAAAQLRALLSQKEEVNMMFAAAPSQNEVLAALCSATDLAWNRVNAFHMDEYVGLQPQHPAGFANFLNRAVFERLPFKSVNLINGNSADPNREAERYGDLLRLHPLDLCLLGVGENGHIAFNDPPTADFHDPKWVKVVELEERCRVQQVHDGCFACLEDVPTHALTVTVPALASAASMFCVVPAPTKANAIRDMLNGPIATACPASILRTHPAAGLYLDLDSGKFEL